MSTARKEAIQKNAKAKDTQAKAEKIVKAPKVETVSKVQDNVIIDDPLAGGVTATVNRYFDSATTLGKAGATTTAIMIEASCYKDGKQLKKGEPLRNALLKKLHSNLETLNGRPLQNLKKNIKATQRLFNKKTVQDRLLGKDRDTKVYFGGLDHLIDRGLISSEQVKSEGLTAGEYCFTVIEAKAESKDYKSREEVNQKHTEEHRPALNASQEDKDAYKYDLEATIKHLQEELKTFSK